MRFWSQTKSPRKPSGLPFGSLREGNVLRKKTKNEQSERARKKVEVRGKVRSGFPAQTRPGAFGPERTFEILEGFGGGRNLIDF